MHTCKQKYQQCSNVFFSLGFLLPFRLPLHRILKPTKTQKRKDRKYEEVTEVFLQVFFRLEDFPPRAREKSFPEPSQGDRTRDNILGEKLKETYLSCFDFQLGRHDKRQCHSFVSLNGFFIIESKIFLYFLCLTSVMSLSWSVARQVSPKVSSFDIDCASPQTARTTMVYLINPLCIFLCTCCTSNRSNWKV